MAMKKSRGKEKASQKYRNQKIKPCSLLKPCGAKQYEQFKNISCVISLLSEVFKYLGSIWFMCWEGSATSYFVVFL